MPKFRLGQFITLKEGTEVVLSGTFDTPPPEKYLNDTGLWTVDHYEGETGMLNIHRTLTPYPGAYCSWVHEDDVVKVR